MHVDTQLRHEFLGLFVQLLLVLDRMDLGTEEVKDTCLVARACAYFEDAVARLDFEELGLECHRKGLGNRLPLSDGKGFVLIGMGIQGGIEEKMPGDGVDGFEDLLVPDAFAAEEFDEFFSLAFVAVGILKLEHGWYGKLLFWLRS